MSDLFACDETKEKFIIAVQNHTCLYNPQAATYSNRQCRMNAWLAIAQECGVPGRGNKFFITKILLIYQLLCIKRMNCLCLLSISAVIFSTEILIIFRSLLCRHNCNIN